VLVTPAGLLDTIIVLAGAWFVTVTVEVRVEHFGPSICEVQELVTVSVVALPVIVVVGPDTVWVTVTFAPLTVVVGPLIVETTV
jgi:hypothetical protein